MNRGFRSTQVAQQFRVGFKLRRIPAAKFLQHGIRIQFSFVDCLVIDDPPRAGTVSGTSVPGVAPAQKMRSTRTLRNLPEITPIQLTSLSASDVGPENPAADGIVYSVPGNSESLLRNAACAFGINTHGTDLRGNAGQKVG